MLKAANWFAAESMCIIMPCPAGCTAQHDSFSTAQHQQGGAGLGRAGAATVSHAAHAHLSISINLQLMQPVTLACRPQPQQQHDLLEQALAEEMTKAARRSGKPGGAPSGVQFKQVGHTLLLL